MIVWADGFGFANVESRTPLTQRTRFLTGSVSKTLTSAAVALLHDRGRIDLDAPVQTYVPSYPRKKWPLSSRQLLGDVAGVHRIRGDSNDNLAYGHCSSLDEALEAFAAEPLSFQPGTKYRFSTYGWVLLSAVIEDASFYFPRMFMRPSLGLQDGPGADYSCLAGAGAFLSTPADLVRLGSAMLKAGLLTAETIKLFQTPLQLGSGASTGFAMGWKVDTIQLAGVPTRVLRHRATPTGSTVSLSLFPDRSLVIGAMTNVTHGMTVDS